MTEMVWLRSHVERCLQHVWENASLEVDEDGDYRFRSESGMGWVSIDDGRPPMVTLWVMAVTGVKSSAGLLREINEINGRSCAAQAILSCGNVIVRYRLPAEAVTPTTFEFAVHSVCTMTDDVGPMIASVYGGEIAIPSETSDAE